MLELQNRYIYDTIMLELKNRYIYDTSFKTILHVVLIFGFKGSLFKV